MHLGPHHFQVQSRYFEDTVQFTAAALWFEPWGLSGCQLDTEALRNGTVGLVHARGFFPDGLAFHMPECDPLPEPRNITELISPLRDSVTVLLAVPERRQSGVNCVSQTAHNGDRARFVAEDAVFGDETTGADEKQVGVGRKNVALLLDSEPLEGMSAIPVARVTRDGSGHLVFDPGFVPPCVQISASARLMQIQERLIEILEEKSIALGQHRKAGVKSWAEYSTRDIASFWLLHTVNSSLVPLRHLFFSKRGHPEELYRELARLAGALCTFALDSHPRDLPLYDHARLDECFNALDRHIRTHLDTVVPTNCVSIPLSRISDYLYEGQIADARCLNAVRWIFAIKSSAGEVEVISKTPQLVKICSKLFVPELVKRALPGMGLTHLPVPPSAVGARADTQYFGVANTGPCWEHITKTREIGIYVPGELPDPKLELLAILES